MPITGCPGKKVHACDQCAGTKKACSSGWPCSGCIAKGRSCTYERLRIRESTSPDSSNLGFEIIDNTEDAFLEPADQFMTLEFAEWALSTPDLFPGSDGNPDGSGRCGVIPHFTFQNDVNQAVPTSQSLRFLLNVVKAGGLNSVFNFERPWTNGESRRQHGKAGSDIPNQDPQLVIDSWLLPINHTQGLNQADDSCPLATQSSGNFNFTHMARWLADPLFSKSKEIWELFRSVTSQTSGTPTEELTAKDGRLLEFFGPVKLRIFLDQFWAGWHPHCPIIHKPTFDPSTASCALVAAMAMIGACMSLGEARSQAQEFLDTLEAVVYQNPLFQDEYLGGESNELLLQTLQAGHFVCILGNWEGYDNSRKRIRQQRFTSLVAVSPPPLPPKKSLL